MEYGTAAFYVISGGYLIFCIYKIASMKKEENNPNSRRKFIRNTALSLAGFYIVPRHVLGGKGYISPSDKLNIAGVGVGGKGTSD